MSCVRQKSLDLPEQSGLFFLLSDYSDKSLAGGEFSEKAHKNRMWEEREDIEETHSSKIFCKF